MANWPWRLGNDASGPRNPEEWIFFSKTGVFLCFFPHFGKAVLTGHFNGPFWRAILRGHSNMLLWRDSPNCCCRIIPTVVPTPSDNGHFGNGRIAKWECKVQGQSLGAKCGGKAMNSVRRWWRQWLSWCWSGWCRRSFGIRKHECNIWMIGVIDGHSGESSWSRKAWI